ncbi:MAG: metallophosphoesterase, partial [Frankiales bacterium]|nr:metallophosphoesterase [Frankiales bacterium]
TVQTTAYAPQLTRAPYLTDLVGKHVAVNFATDRSATTGSIVYGAVDDEDGCTPTTTVAASRTSITVGTVLEYQWTAQVNVPAAGRYCYRAFLGGTDLLVANASPRFTTQVPVGSAAPFTFGVMGDWGQADGGSPADVDRANLMSQIAASGLRFMLTAGDNGYPTGNQINYGDLQQTGANVSAIFGPQSWSVPGQTTPIFTAAGNHGLSGTSHTDITTWTQQTAVATSGGRYQNDVYCCVNGTTSSNYGSEWYAFDAGNARFYVLDAAWSDGNKGTATAYANDALAHFAPGAPEYEWLKRDLETHSAQLKFAAFHYPLYSDSNTESSDPFLQGPDGLEGLLGANGVQLVFNGHAHIYERNTPSAPGMPVSYVTGGGGAKPGPVGRCHSYDAYAIGWSNTSQTGSSCGSAVAPTSAANVFHILKVTVSGMTVTVTPTDSTGQTFDVQTYTFPVAPNTYLDTTPAGSTGSTSATFAFHASDSPATFACRLDGGAAGPCASPVTYTGLAGGPHSFSVAATVAGVSDRTPATHSWSVDVAPPSTPAGLVAAATSPWEVSLSWNASQDDTAVTGYRIQRDGTPLATVGAGTAFTDTVSSASTHSYAVSAFDAAGNESPLGAVATVTTPAPAVPVFQNGFESGALSAWSSSAGLVVQTGTVHTGTFAAEGRTTVGNTFAKRTLPATYADGYARVAFDVLSQTSQVNLLRLRDSASGSLGYVYLDPSGRLAFRNDVTATSSVSPLVPGPGWHDVELRIAVDSTAGTATGTVQVWLDNVLVPALANAAVDVGAARIGVFQIGEVQSGRTYDVVFDDAAFGTSRLGPSTQTGAP